MTDNLVVLITEAAVGIGRAAEHSSRAQVRHQVSIGAQDDPAGLSIRADVRKKMPAINMLSTWSIGLAQLLIV